LGTAIFRILALCAAISVSGAHLPFLQAGAWLMMFHERAGSDRGDTSLVALAAEIVSGADPCQRCHLTQQATLETRGTQSEDSPRIADQRDLRLVLSETPLLRIVPPAPLRRGYFSSAAAMPESWLAAPPCPPPDARA